MRNIGRNDPCPCGSGKKNKHCCGAQSAIQAKQRTLSPASAAPLLERAVQLHRAGQISQAEALYRQALDINPNQPDALHLLGVIAAQNGNFSQSAQLIEQAIKKNPRNPVFHNNLGNAYRQIDDDSMRCIASYREAIKLDSGYAEAHNNLGNALKRKGDLATAIIHYKAALKRNPALVEAALGLGNSLQQLGQTEGACEVFTQLINNQPNSSEAFISLGASQFKLGRFNEAESSLLQALRLNRGSASAYYNLGLVLNAQERFEPAAESLSMAIKLKPDYPEAFFHLGLALQANNLHQAAEQALKKSFELDPKNSLALIRLSESKAAMGALDEAISICNSVIAAQPELSSAHYRLAMHLLKSRAIEPALASFRTALALGDNSPSVLHMIAALEGQTPKTASEQYVTEVFDGYAAKFDKHLVEGLKYDSPSHLLQMANQYWRRPDKAWRTLDLGCGTGLCGVAFGPHSREMIGVDLSSKMLDKARARDLYQQLVHSDLLSMMRAEPEASFDIVIAADVFVYIGELTEIYAEAQRLLTPGGLFLFSVESSDALLQEGQLAPATDYQLLLSGRYAHASSYLQQLAAANNLQVLALESRVLRMESNAPINGWCMVLTPQAN